MKLESAAKVKYGSWGLIVGAVVTMILGFVWGGWTTASTAHGMSEKADMAFDPSTCLAVEGRRVTPPGES